MFKFVKPEVQRESPFDDCTTSDIKQHDTHMPLHCGLTGGVTWLNTVFFVGQVIIFTLSAKCRKEHFVPSHGPVLQSRSLHLSPVWTGGVLTVQDLTEEAFCQKGRMQKGVWALWQKCQALALKAPWQKDHSDTNSPPSEFLNVVNHLKPAEAEWVVFRHQNYLVILN